jgi:hypothetical protein
MLLSKQENKEFYFATQQVQTKKGKAMSGPSLEELYKKHQEVEKLLDR